MQNLQQDSGRQEPKQPLDALAAERKAVVAEMQRRYARIARIASMQPDR